MLNYKVCSLLVQQYSLILFLCLTPTEWPLTGNTYCLLNMCPAYALHLTNMLTSYSYLRHALLLLSTLVMYELVRWNTMTQIAPLAHDRVEYTPESDLSVGIHMNYRFLCVVETKLEKSRHQGREHDKQVRELSLTSETSRSAQRHRRTST